MKIYVPRLTKSCLRPYCQDPSDNQGYLIARVPLNQGYAQLRFFGLKYSTLTHVTFQVIQL